MDIRSSFVRYHWLMREENYNMFSMLDLSRTMINFDIIVCFQTKCYENGFINFQI